MAGIDWSQLAQQFGQSLQSGPSGTFTNPYGDISQLIGGQGVNPFSSFLNIGDVNVPPLSAYQPHGDAALAQRQIEQSLAQEQTQMARRIAALWPQPQQQTPWSPPQQVSVMPDDYWTRLMQSIRGF